MKQADYVPAIPAQGSTKPDPTDQMLRAMGLLIDLQSQCVPGGQDWLILQDAIVHIWDGFWAAVKARSAPRM